MLTLARAAAAHAEAIRMVCRTCRHDGAISLVELLRWYGPDRRIDALRFACKNCGSRAVDGELRYKPGVRR